MPCDTVRQQPKQTLAERKREVTKAQGTIERMISTGQVKVKVDKKTGGVVLIDVPANVRVGITAACIVRRIMTRGSISARQAIVKAERLAGRSVDKKAIAAGLHSHDGGATWGTD